MTKMVRQADLYWIESPDSTRTMTTWLDDRPDLSVGVMLTLKGSPRPWVVGKLYEVQDPKSINRGWKNDYTVKAEDRGK